MVLNPDDVTTPQTYDFVLAIAEDDDAETSPPVQQQQVQTPSHRHTARLLVSPAAQKNSGAARFHTTAASIKRSRKMSRVAASFPNGSMSTMLGSRDGSSGPHHQLGPQDLEWLLTTTGRWQLQYANEALEGEFAMFFHRSRLPSQYWVGLQTVLIIGIMASAGPESRIVLGLLIAALVVMVVAIGIYGYLRGERSRMARLYRESTRSATSTVDLLNIGNNGEYPEVWFRADTLIARDDAGRNKLRRNAEQHELVTWLLVPPYCMMFTAFVLAKDACSSEVSVRTCYNAILFESSFLVFQLIVVTVIPQRMARIAPTLLATLGFALAVKWLPFMPSVAYAEYWSSLALFTNSTLLLLVCCYFLERRKRHAFGEVVWHCVIAQRSEVLRQQVRRMTKAAFPFDIDAFLWQQNSPLLPPQPQQRSPTAGAHLFNNGSAAAVHRLVFAESRDATVAVLKVRGFAKWCATMSPSDVVRALQDVFTIFERMISVTTQRTGASGQSHFGSSSFGNSVAGSFMSNGSSSSRTEAVGSDVVLSVLPQEQLFKSTFGDSFLVVVLPPKKSAAVATSSSTHHSSGGDVAANNPLLLQSTAGGVHRGVTRQQPLSPRGGAGGPSPATAAILHRMVAFCVSCIAKAVHSVEEAEAAQQCLQSTTIGGSDGDVSISQQRSPKTPPPLVHATIATGAVSAAATGGARGVHVYFTGAAVDAALSAPPPPLQVAHQQQHVRGAGGSAAEPSVVNDAMLVVVQSSRETEGVVAAIAALGGDVKLATQQMPSQSASHRRHAAFAVPFPCVVPSIASGGGTPVDAGGGSDDRQAAAAGVLRSSRRLSGALSGSTGSSCLSRYTVLGSLCRYGEASSVGEPHRLANNARQQQEPSPALLAVDVPEAQHRTLTAEPNHRRSQQVSRRLGHLRAPTRAPATTTTTVPPTTCCTRVASAMYSALYYVFYRPFEDEALEQQFLCEARAFHRDRLLLLAVCGMCTGLVLAGIAAIALFQDDVGTASILSTNPREAELIWFALCFLWAMVIFLLSSFFGAAASRPLYYILFLLYAGCYCTGIFVSSEGTVIYNSPTAWLFPIVGLSLLRPTWEGPGAASVPDVILVVVFFLRERTMVPSVTRAGQAASVQIAVNIAQFIAIRFIQERMERSFFATRAESAAYSVQVEDHVHTLDDILRTIAPDKRIARELARALQRAVDAQQENFTCQIGGTAGAAGSSNEQTVDEHGNAIPLEIVRVAPEYVHDTVIAASVHDTPFLMVRLSLNAATGPSEREDDAFHTSKAILHSLLQNFVVSLLEDDGTHISTFNVDRSSAADSVFFVQDPLGTLGATIVCNHSQHLLPLLDAIETTMQETPFSVVTAVLGCGTHIGAVIGGGRREDGIGAARFDIYGGAVATHRALLTHIEDGSIVATARFRLYTAKLDVVGVHTSTDGSSEEGAAVGEHHRQSSQRNIQSMFRRRQRLAEGTALRFLVDGVSLHGVFL